MSSQQRLLAIGVMMMGLAIAGVEQRAIAIEKAPVLTPSENLPAEDLPAEDLPSEDLPSEDLPSEDLPPESPIQRPYAPLRPYTACPADIETLMALLIRDIPSYTNRVLQRSVAVLPRDSPADWRVAAGLVRSPYRPSSVLIAGQLELEPLNLNDYVLTTSPTGGGPITQAFFTTLSRQYSGQYSNQPSNQSSNQPLNRNRLSVQEVQEYHWLLLTPASDGWRLVLMFSAVDDLKSPRPLLPPRENSQGSVGQAVQLWLTDCRAGAIYPLESPPENSPVIPPNNLPENPPNNLPENPPNNLPDNLPVIPPAKETF